MVSEEFLMRELISSWNAKVNKMERDIEHLKRQLDSQSVYIHNLEERVNNIPV